MDDWQEAGSSSTEAPPAPEADADRPPVAIVGLLVRSILALLGGMLIGVAGLIVILTQDGVLPNVIGIVVELVSLPLLWLGGTGLLRAIGMALVNRAQRNNPDVTRL